MIETEHQCNDLHTMIDCVFLDVTSRKWGIRFEMHQGLYRTSDSLVACIETKGIGLSEDDAYRIGHCALDVLEDTGSFPDFSDTSWLSTPRYPAANA